LCLVGGSLVEAQIRPDGVSVPYLGRALASEAEQTTTPDAQGEPLDVVRMLLRFEKAIESTLLDCLRPAVTA
jgi:hypothetical protein